MVRIPKRVDGFMPCSCFDRGLIRPEAHLGKERLGRRGNVFARCIASKAGRAEVSSHRMPQTSGLAGLARFFVRLMVVASSSAVINVPVTIRSSRRLKHLQDLILFMYLKMKFDHGSGE